jgi:hypothetical protein
MIPAETRQLHDKPIPAPVRADMHASLETGSPEQFPLQSPHKWHILSERIKVPNVLLRGMTSAFLPSPLNPAYTFGAIHGHPSLGAWRTPLSCDA